jgi:plastocyanin
MRSLLLAIVATLAFAPAANAQGATVQAIDSPPSWSPSEVTIKAGETVTWTWANPHNVKSASANWNVQSGYTGPFAHTFAAPGTYDYLCQLHAGMTGKVIVTDASGNPPPPPPPPPPSEQQWLNDLPAPTVFERVDEVRPRLSRVRVAPVTDGARVRFRLSERARVIVRFKRAGIAVKTVRRSFGAGDRSLVVRERRMQGRYRVEVVARDLSGNRSRIRHARLTLR